MATDIVYGTDVPDGSLTGSNPTYATARSTASTVDVTDNYGYAGQTKFSNYVCYELFGQFNTAAIGTDTVSSAILSYHGDAYASTITTNCIIQARISNWGASLTTADWVAGASLSSLTLVATFDTTGFTKTAYMDFTDVAMPANINGSGITYLLLSSDRMAAGTAPSNGEAATFDTAHYAGTTYDPKLTITHAPAGGAIPQLLAPRAYLGQAITRASVY